MDSMIMAAYLSENLKTIFAYAANRIADKSEAEDLTSEIVLALLESAPRLRNPDALYGFIWSVAGNTYKKYLQRRKRREIPLPEDQTAAQQAGYADRRIYGG